MPTVVPHIRPISDLRTDLNDVCSMAQASQEPLFMTKNGKPCLVVMDCDAYEQQRQHERFVHKLREAEIEEKYCPATRSLDEVKSHMEDIFAVWEK
ncbi:MAG: type II toxin-antitoxin system Phd/YefM family antitoxin [Raoultibacter sp.]